MPKLLAVLRIERPPDPAGGLNEPLERVDPWVFRFKIPLYVHFCSPRVKFTGISSVPWH